MLLMARKYVLILEIYLTVKAVGALTLNANNGKSKIQDGGSAFAGQIDLEDNTNVTVSALISDKDVIY